MSPVCECGLPGIAGRGLCNNCYARFRRRMLAYERWDGNRVDPTETRDHLAALRAAGMGLRRISALTGLSRPTLQRVPLVVFVSRNTRDQILAVPLPEMAFDEVLASGTQINAVGSARRLRALARIGWPSAVVAAEFGVNRARVTALTGGRQLKVTVARAAEIAALFDRLHMVAGPSRTSARRAELRGWPFPLAWDEDTIDDPNAKPAPERGRAAPLHVGITELKSLGVHDKDRLAVLLHTSTEHVERTLIRLKEAS